MRTFISDPEDERLADYRHLADPASRPDRDATAGFFIVEGWEAVVRLLATDWDIRSVLVAEDKADRLSTGFSVTKYIAPRAVLESTVGFQLHRGVVAAVNRRATRTTDDVTATARVLAILEGINDHENLGAIFRTAATLGVDGILLDPTCADPFYRRCVRVSMGTVLTLPHARVENWPAELATLSDLGFGILAATPGEEAIDIARIDWPERAAVMFGSEANGLSQSALSHADIRFRIPQQPGYDSLNVGHAAAIALYMAGVVSG